MRFLYPVLLDALDVDLLLAAQEMFHIPLSPRAMDALTEAKEHNLIRSLRDELDGVA